MQKLPRIHRESLRDRVAELVKQAIADGLYPSGSRLPSEERLAQQLGVGRSSVREAIEHLVALGLVVRLPGRGVFVARPQDFAEKAMDNLVPALLLNPASMEWLLEVRQVVEPKVAALAAVRASEQDIAELALLVRDLEAQRYEPTRYARTDLQFHRRIAEASGNPLFPRILKTVHSLFVQELEMTVKVPGATDRSFPFHRRIFEAIQQHDPNAAETQMAEHLKDVQLQLVDLKLHRRYPASTEAMDPSNPRGGV